MGEGQGGGSGVVQFQVEEVFGVGDCGRVELGVFEKRIK